MASNRIALKLLTHPFSNFVDVYRTEIHSELSSSLILSSSTLYVNIFGRSCYWNKNQNEEYLLQLKKFPAYTPHIFSNQSLDSFQ